MRDDKEAAAILQRYLGYQPGAKTRQAFAKIREAISVANGQILLMGRNQTSVAPLHLKAAAPGQAQGQTIPRSSRQSPGCGSALFSEQAWGEINRSLRLSVREEQIVRAVFDDRTEACIALDLGISAHTVHTHIERLHKKLCVVDRVALVLRVVNEFLKLTRAPGSPMRPICATWSAGGCLTNMLRESTNPRQV